MPLNNARVVRKGADFGWLRAQAQDALTLRRLAVLEHWVRQAPHGQFHPSAQIFALRLWPYTLWLRRADAWQSLAIYTEIFKEDDHLLLPSFEGADARTIVDLGANIGLYTLRMRQQNPTAQIIAVEPNPPTVTLLETNIRGNHLAGITVVPAAIGSTPGCLTLKHVAQASAFAGKYLGTLKTAQRPWVTDALITAVDVPCVTLPQLFTQYGLTAVDLLKMDIEEMELEVLQAGSAILSGIRRIVIEWHTLETKARLIAFLTGRGFRLIYEEPRSFGDLYFEQE